VRGLSGFVVEPAHFVERHGLVLIVAIGESVVAVGLGASGLAVDAALALVALLGLTLSACLWWFYFGDGDDEGAERAAMEPLDRARTALTGFFYCYLAMLLGIVTIAAAEESALEHPFSSLEWSHAVLLGGGVFVYLIGDALFRHQLTLGTSSSRLVAAALALATIPIGAETSAATQIGTLVAILSASILLASRANAKRAGR
jgi:low temperature requirement protein LtrA